MDNKIALLQLLVVVFLHFNIANGLNAIPVIKGDPPVFLTLNSGSKCAGGHYCPIDNGVCCKGGKLCCETYCNDATDPPTCDASPEQKALALARAVMKNEADIQIQHENNQRAKKEEGRKAVAEAKEKGENEEKTKKEKAANEAAEKAKTVADEEKSKKEKEAAEGESKEKEKQKILDESKKRASDEAKTKSMVIVNNNHVITKGKLYKRNNELQETGEFTYAFWIFPKAKSNGWTTILQKGATSSERSPAIFLRPSTTKLAIRSDTVSKTNFGQDWNGDLPVYKWTHVAFVHKKGSYQIWINGNRVVSVNSDALRPNKGHLYVSSPFYNNANAVISDLRYYAGAQTPQKIKEILDAKKYVDIKIPELILFSGLDHPRQHKKIAKHADLKWSGKWSYTFWLKPLGYSLHWSNILHKGAANNQRDPAIWFYPRSSRLLIVSRNINFSPPQHLAVNQWTHVAITHSNNRFKVYFNSQLVKNVAAPPPLINQGDLYLSDPWHRESPTLITDLRYSDKILSHTRVREIYNEKKHSDAVPKIANWIHQFKYTPSKNRMLLQSGQRASWAWTYTFWVHPKGTKNHWSQLFHKGNSNSHRNPAIWFYPHQTRLHIRVGTRRSWNDGLDPSTQLTKHQWTHVAFTWYEKHACVYYNGDKVSCTGSGLEPVWRNEPMRGCSAWYNGAPAEMSDFRYYDIPLHQDLIRKIKAENKK